MCFNLKFAQFCEISGPKPIGLIERGEHHRLNLSQKVPRYSFGGTEPLHKPLRKIPDSWWGTLKRVSRERAIGWLSIRPGELHSSVAQEVDWPRCPPKK
jgi:hypothetical protein